MERQSANPFVVGVVKVVVFSRAPSIKKRKKEKNDAIIFFLTIAE